MALQRGLRDLRDEVEEAREQVPKIPAIADRLTAEQKHLEAEQARLERELAKTKDRISKMRIDQSIMSYGLDELRKQTEASSAASIEMEFESQTSRFQMRAAHPAAAQALKEFATKIIDGTDGILWLPGPVGNA